MPFNVYLRDSCGQSGDIVCRIEELEKEHTQLNGERQRLQEDLEEVQERLTAGVLIFLHARF